MSDLRIELQAPVDRQIDRQTDRQTAGVCIILDIL